MDVRDAAVAALLLGPLAAVASAQMEAAKISSNETAAVATLRNLASCQAQVQTSGKIDGDRDGIGEYGTFLEMTGSVGIRTGLSAPREKSGDLEHRSLGTTFRRTGKPLSPPILSPALADVDGMGFVAKSGYAYAIFLPDAARPAGFVHETGPAASVGLAGGTKAVGVDLSETNWCAYAQPVKRGETGNRRFFVNQAGDVMQSPNEVAKAGGTENAIAPDSALRGTGITSVVAVGTHGRDGDLWKVTN